MAASAAGDRDLSINFPNVMGRRGLPPGGWGWGEGQRGGEREGGRGGGSLVGPAEAQQAVHQRRARLGHAVLLQLGDHRAQLRAKQEVH